MPRHDIREAQRFVLDRDWDTTRAYQIAVDSGHADHAPKAAYGLGLLRREQGLVPAHI